MSTINTFHRVLFCALVLPVLSSPALGQFGDPSGTVSIDPGAIGVIGPSPTGFDFRRRETGATQRCANLLALPNNDYIQYAFGTAGIGSPFQPSTTPWFVDHNATVLSNVLIDDEDVLTNPGTHYNSMLLGTGQANTIGGSSTQANLGFTKHDAPRVNGTRFDGGQGAYDGYTFTGSVTDAKTNAAGASYGVIIAEETFEIVPQVFRNSFGGAIAFDVSLPQSITGSPQVPGAAAVGLTTTMIMSSGTQFGAVGGEISEENCFRMASIVASVSEGVSDGIDNMNTGLRENLFGNGDVGTIVGNSYFNVNGGVTISSSPDPNQFGVQDYHVAGTWNTPQLKFANFIDPNQNVFVTFRHTLTMIADPGAEVSLRSMTQQEFDVLPTDADIFLVASGTLVPEPSTLVMGMTMLFAAVGGRTRATRAC